MGRHKILAAEPGDYITTARKEKNTANWFIGAITDENSRQAMVPLAFLDKDIKYSASIYHDAANADWKENPEAYTIEHFIVDRSSILHLTLAAGGGAAISIKPATAADIKQLKRYK